MFILILIGLYLKKKNIIQESGKDAIMDLILVIVLPCNILKAFSVDFGENILQKFAIIFLIASFVQVLAYFITKLAYNRFDDRKKAVFQYATVCSNSGFMGNPVIEGIYGSIGLTYNSIFLIPLRVMMWTAGVSYFSEKSNKKALMKSILTHPCMLATYFGFVLMLTPLAIPEFALGAITACSNSCTALTMIYIGTIVADVRLKEMIDLDQLYFSFVRLIFMPLVVFIGCKLCGVDSFITAVSVILTGMPGGSTTSLLAAKYGGDTVSATKCVVCSTILSMLTLPVWCYIVAL
ncbi:MAG: AEC family transporter [Clostridia bacterium]